MSTDRTNKRKRITIGTKVAIKKNAADKVKEEKSKAQICRDWKSFQAHSSSLFPNMGITTTLPITTLSEKKKSCRYYPVPLYRVAAVKKKPTMVVVDH